jgi:putative prophage pi3 protein 59
MQQENKVLGILTIVFGATALVGSWIPIINYLSFFIATLALVLGIVGLVINQKGQKTLAIIGSIISFFALIIALVTQAFYSHVFNEAGKKIESFASSYSSYIDSSEREEEKEKEKEKEKEEETKFAWTKAEFDALKEGDILKRGAGGTKYDDIIRDHGKPTDETISTGSDYERKTVSYITKGREYQIVILTFSKNEDGSFLLTSKIATGLE